MKVHRTKTWQHEVIGLDGNTILFGVNIFDYEWKRTGEKIDVEDPLYGQKHRFPIYKILIDEQEYEFAAGEFSNCVYGFYVKKY